MNNMSIAYITREMVASIIALLDDGQKIRAIKLLRSTEVYGKATMSLRLSKFAIDRFQEQLPSSLDLESALMIDLDEQTDLFVDFINIQARLERQKAYRDAADLGISGRAMTAEILCTNLERIPQAMRYGAVAGDSYEAPNTTPKF